MFKSFLLCPIGNDENQLYDYVGLSWTQLGVGLHATMPHFLMLTVTRLLIMIDFYDVSVRLYELLVNKNQVEFNGW